MRLEEIRLLILNQTEDYRQAVVSGDLDSQALHALEAMTKWGFQVQEVGVLGVQSSQAYNEVLETGLRVIGSGMSIDANSEDILKLVADFCPTHLVVQVPRPEIFRWAVRHQVNCIAVLHQSFSNLSLKKHWQNYQLSKWLNHEQIVWVGNQGVQTCYSLQSIGVDVQKVIPWCWPQALVPLTYEPKPMRSQLNPLHLIYVGPVITTKGVGDLLIAMAQLQAQGRQVYLQVVGKGEIDRFKSQARQLQLVDCIEFIDRSSYSTVRDLIQLADVMVIPNRYEYPEATAVSLIHNGLAVHTPIVASDHPMLVSLLHHGVNAMLFPAGNARALAQQIDHLASQPHLYAKLSGATLGTSSTTQLPVTWATLVERWFQGSSQDHLWLKNHSLASGKYQSAISPFPSTIQRSA
jgi:glycosyltransferase involved in cell wall biosynthesis